MNIVTVMNYDWSDKNCLAMCCSWIRQARIHLSNSDSCFIFSNKSPHPLLRLFVGDDYRFKFCVRDGMKYDSRVFFSNCGSKSNGKNFTYKLYIACQLDFPFVFIDADALIVGSLGDLEIALEDMPVAFVDHENDIEGHTKILPPFINSGVFLVNDPHKKIFNWDRIFDHAVRCGFSFRFRETNRRIPGTDQALIKSYLDSIGYAYRHERFGLEYNTCARGLTWKKDRLGWVVKNSKEEIVKIAHYWGQFRPWSVNCPIFMELLDDKMFSDYDGLDKIRERKPNN